MTAATIVTITSIFWVLRLKKQLKTCQKIELELRYRSEYDFLSGLKNRNAFAQYIQGIEDKPITVVACDIDCLKIINDTFGHWAGDQLIRKTAYLLKKVTPPDSVIFRMGGDEFLVIMPYNDSFAQTQKINDLVKEQVFILNQKQDCVPLSLSIGIANKTSDTISLADAIKQADMLMYEQKRICRERVLISFEKAIKRE